MNQEKSHKQYSKKYFQKPFPPNHNPLIGSMKIDTLCNVRDAIQAVQELTSLTDRIELTSNSSSGLHFLTNCILDALQFEIQHRK